MAANASGYSKASCCQKSAFAGSDSCSAAKRPQTPIQMASRELSHTNLEVPRMLVPKLAATEDARALEAATDDAFIETEGELWVMLCAGLK